MAIRHDPLQLPVVNAKYLFRSLCKLYRADLICDVGSFDGAHALGFCRPGARVVALEANPCNAVALADNVEVANAGIDVFHLAAWNKNEDITFNVIDVPGGAPDDWRNMISSIRTRTDYEFGSRKVSVQATRLDSFIASLDIEKPASVALWIDVEGVGFEVLQGIRDIHEDVCVIHIEVETSEFWERQKLWPAVLDIMTEFGFSAVARRRGDLQIDVVFVNEKFRRTARVATRWLIVLAWVRIRAGAVRNMIRRFA